MSFYTYYQAIPEPSRLLERLRSDTKFRGLYTRLIPYGPGPFHLEKLDPDELDDILDDFAEDELFGSRAEVDRCFKEITAELARAVAGYPGLGDRAAYIEKHHDEIEALLARELRRSGSEDDVKRMTELLYVGDALASSDFDQYDSQLRLLPAATVARGAKMLAGIGLADDQYQEWRGLMNEAANRSEALIVFPTG